MSPRGRPKAPSRIRVRGVLRAQREQMMKDHIALTIRLAAILALTLLGQPASAQDGQDAGHSPAPAHTDNQPAHVEGDDHAAGGHDDHKASPLPSAAEAYAPAITAIIVFLVVLFVISTKVAPKIIKGLEDREHKIADEISQAEKAREQAKQALSEYERSLAEAKAEARRMLEETKARQQQFEAELKSKADAAVASMKDRARRDIEAAKRQALSEIYAEASMLATTMAGKILRRSVNEADQKRLLDESLAELKSQRN